MTDTGQPVQRTGDSTSLPSSGDEVYYSYACESSFFALVCAVLPVAIFAAAWSPHVSGELRLLVWGMAAFIILMELMGIGPALARWWYGKGITLTETGIRGRRRFIEWREITGIRMHPLQARTVTLRLDGRPRSVLRRLLLSPVFRLPSFPVVFGEVLPHIYRRRPDLPVPENLRRAMADPEAATSYPRWLGAVLLVPLVLLVITPFLMRNWHFMWGFFPLVLLGGISIVFAGLPAPHTPQQWFALASPSLVPLLPYVMITAIFSSVPRYALNAVVAGFAVVILSASILSMTRAKLTVLRKAAILTMTVLVPALIYAHGVKTSWPKEDITHLVNPPGAWDLFWSEDGALAVHDRVDGNQQRVIDLSTLKATPLPIRAGWPQLRWLDRSHVVRITRAKGDWAIYVFSFRDRRERRVSRSGPLRCGRIRCIAPNGRTLCWLEVPEDGPNPSLRSYDLAEDRAGAIDVDWMPDAAKIEWRGPNWLDDDTVVVWGHDTDPNTPGGATTTLHLLHVRPKEKTTRHTIRKSPLKYWSPSPDFRHAFSHDRHALSSSSRPVLYFDLQADRSAELPAGSVPIWQTDNRYAFRAVHRKEQGTWICRFDPRTMREEPFFKIPADCELLAVSPKGRFALIRTIDKAQVDFVESIATRDGQIAVVELATGRMRWTGAPFPPLFFDSDRKPRVDRGGTSIWSPDERRIVLPDALSLKGPRTYLYAIPDAWLARKAEPRPTGGR